jgi:hypothetical protein
VLPLPLAPVLSILGLPSAVTLYTAASTIGSDGVESVTETSTPIRAIVAPAQYRDLERLPEGHRSAAALVVLSATSLPVDAQIAYAQPGDAGSQRWLIVSSEDWRTQCGHYRAVCVSV